MATYAIGDVQGCFEPLMQLLKKIKFNKSKDTLWFTGDIVNRGPQSLDVLRFIKSLGKKQITVLGNHDLHLIATYHGAKLNQYDTFNDILKATDSKKLIKWLCEQPLFHYDSDVEFALVHAGLAVSWSIEKTLSLAQEVSDVLQSDKLPEFLHHMYGNDPDHWSDDLTGFPRWRIITNYLTRARYCYLDGRMNFNYKGPLHEKPAELVPWYDVHNRKSADTNIIFGHWAALDGKVDRKKMYALDTGCIWGRCLTAFRLEDEKRFSVNCPERTTT